MEMDIPDKLAFRRREVVNITRLDGKVLDYWEREFDLIKPLLSKKGEKFYTKKDIGLILRIKELLVVEKRSKESVKNILREEIPGLEIKEKGLSKSEKPDLSGLDNVKNGLKEILTLLDNNDKN